MTGTWYDTTGTAITTVTLVPSTTPTTGEVWTYLGSTPTVVTSPPNAAYLGWKIQVTGDNLETTHLGGVRISQVKRRNLAPYPNAELGTTVGWTTGSVNCAVTASTAHQLQGTYSYLMTSSAAGLMSASNLVSPSPAYPGTTYTETVWMRADSIPRQVRMDITFYNSSMVSLGTTTGVDTPTTTTSTWTSVSNVATAPATTAWVVATPVVLGAAGAGELHYFDGLLVEVGSAIGTYFDGSSTGYSWAGTANASASFTTPPPYRDPRLINVVMLPVRTNWCPNPSFETNTNFWNTQGATTTLARTMTSPAFGTGRGELTRVTSTGDAGIFSNLIAANPGQVWTLSAYGRALTTSRSMEIDLEWHDAAGNYLSTSYGSTVADTTSGYVRVSVTGTAPAGTGSMRILVWFKSCAVGEVHALDGVLAEISPLLGDYFDAGQNIAVTNEVLWEGGASNAAPSYMYPELLPKRNRLAALLPEYIPATTPWRLVFPDKADWKSLRNTVVGEPYLP
jgi:hypothetical protein